MQDGTDLVSNTETDGKGDMQDGKDEIFDEEGDMLITNLSIERLTVSWLVHN